MKLLHSQISPETYDVVKKIIFSVWIFQFLRFPVPELSGFLPEVFRPTGFFLLDLPSGAQDFLISSAGLWFVHTAGLISIICFFFNVGSRITGLISCVFITFHQGLVRSFGYMNHAELAILYAAYIFAVTDTVKSFDKQVHRAQGYHQSALVIAAFVLCMTYSYTGIFRLAASGFSLFTSDAMTVWIMNRSYEREVILSTVGKNIENYPAIAFFLSAGFFVVAILEVLAPLCLVSRRFRNSFVCVMSGFHIGSWLLMDIFFWENMILFILFFDVDRWFAPKKTDGRKPVIFFDGVCGLCDRFITWVIARDRNGIFQLAPLQGKSAAGLLPAAKTGGNLKSIVLKDQENIYTQSSAVLRIGSGLGGVWRILSVFLCLIPKFIRDFCYRFIAEHRYQWFGKRDVCRVPNAQERARFLP